MKQLLAALFLMSIASVSHAKSFKPTSGMTFFCKDDVSYTNYVIKIVDIGDEEAHVKAFEGGEQVLNTKAHFEQYAGGSFLAVYENGRESFTINFPGNKLEDIYYADGGDSRALECKIRK